MVTINNILGEAEAINPADRAVTEWARIQEKPASIEIVRKGVAGKMTAQTVRVEYTRGSGLEARGETGISDVRLGTVFGVQDHPTESDLDIQRGDRFLYHGAWYFVTSVASYPGQIQAVVDFYDSKAG